MKPAIQKCAIYTRKSTDKGLDQEFNTLDAQREACLAYIASQKSEGWMAGKQHYDDGGYSGGNLGRPALRQMLEDIKAGKINIVVVYKIDRLTRALTDFAKLVEVFDQYGVSFVSVTQSFNTTTSMGRLTLNVLLSFAQFEREVIGERIRDKIAASKKKGMWMGGNPMLGYDIRERQLVINEPEATTVKYIFDRYLDIGSVSGLKEHLNAKEIKSKSWVSVAGKKREGQYYSRGALYALLRNPVYAGYIRHKGEMHVGLHEGIIFKEKWEQVQNCLMSKACTVRGEKKHSVKSILKGKLFDSEGVIYTPMRANKNGKQYRYYVSQSRVQNRHRPNSVIGRLPAHEIETLILDALVVEIADINKLSNMLALDIESHHRMLEHIAKSAQAITDIHETIHKVTVDVDYLVVDVCVKSMAERMTKALTVGLSINDDGRIHRLTIPYHTKRARKGAVMVRSGDGRDPLDLPKNRLESLVKGVIWRDNHFAGKSFYEIARENNCSRSYVLQTIQKSFEIV